MGLKASDLPPALRQRMGIDAPTVNKYHVAPVEQRTTDGIKFASKAEMHRYRELVNMQKAGVVKFFLRQTPFHLPGGVKYLLDFMVHWTDGHISYEDTKGCRTAMYILKRKQVEALYPITITEIHRDPMRKKRK